MTYRHFKHEGLLYTLAFLVALALRFMYLGAMPLTDAEALPALQALHIAQGLKPALSPHSFYILFTSVPFFIYGGGTDFLARFLPALFGSLLVFVPLLFVDRIKPRPALILAFFIALDPGMVSISRQAASPIFAIAFLLFALGFVNRKKESLAGFFAALALLSGPSIWAGILGLALAWAIFQAVSFRRPAPAQSSELDLSTSDSQSSTVEEEPSTSNFQFSNFNVRSFAVPLILTFLIAGSLFSLAPNGLSAAFSSIPAYMSSWLTPSDVSAGRLLFSLLVYQPFGILLALIAIVRGWFAGSRRIIPLSVWFFVALLLAVFTPSRQMADLSWALIPLWTMAALEFARNVDVFIEERSEVAGVAFLTAFVWAFTWLDFSGLVWLPVGSSEYTLRLWLLLGSLFLLTVSLLLVAAGWSIRTARLGGIWGLAFAFGVLGFGGALGSAGLRGANYPELWWPSNLPDQAHLLEATVGDLSEWGLGNRDIAPVVIAGVNSPALEWTLREHKVQVIDASQLDVSSAPYFVVTPLQDNLALSSAYRGQDFVWRQTPLWNSATLPDWIRWTSLREIPQSSEAIVLWVRDDLFLDNSAFLTNP